MTGPTRDERGRFVARPKPDPTAAEQITRSQQYIQDNTISPQDVRDLGDWYDKGGVLPPAPKPTGPAAWALIHEDRKPLPAPRRRRIALRVAIVVLILIALAAAGIWYGHR